ncbi:hypothetical protein [Rhizobium rhizogenes]|uniref:hypothetical protein n=1 Tax=Rhizobium rhizogenes TaxID=359 RepID=UPI0015741CC4|nr:hypothetical protein [Rhizobium rhizogenes]NTF63414.1 hypothetical protein [Rhizobium rhizogenes]NTG94746.1 hypothetical protein [Rhizobium rhizogenes]
MGSWAGYKSPEFGVYPVELQFSLDSHVGPGWVVPALFNRSGWLAVAEVEMETDFDRTRSIIAACINDEGEILGPWVTEALFSMQCSLPREVVTEPPDDLADALDALYWDFLGRCDLSHLHALEEKERQITSSIARLEVRRQEVYDRVESFLSGLYARRRREIDRPDIRELIDVKVAEIDLKQAETESWHRQQLTVLHAELEAFDVQVLASLQNHGNLQPLYTVHWETRHSKVRTLANTGFEMRFGLPRADTVELNVGEIELDAKLHRMGISARRRREFTDYYDRLNAAMEEAKAQDNTLREIARALADKPKLPRAAELSSEQSKAAALRTLAERSRAWESRKKLETSQLGRDPRRRILKKKPVNLKQKMSAYPLVVAIEENAAQEVEAVISTSVKPVITADAGARLGDTPAKVTPAIESVSPEPSPEYVRAGDRVLLRFVDPPGPRVQYWLTGVETDPTKGIVALDDARALAILGKRVGEQVSFLINREDRIAVIEQIFASSVCTGG